MKVLICKNMCARCDKEISVLTFFEDSDNSDFNIQRFHGLFHKLLAKSDFICDSCIESVAVILTEDTEFKLHYNIKELEYYG